MSRRKRSALAVLAIGSLALATACAKGNAGAPATSSAPTASKTDLVQLFTPAKVSIGTADDSKGPAIPPEGVVKGGTVNMIDRDDYAHLDPGRIYDNVAANFSLLITRQLTGYKRVAKGEYKVVGDLATDTGQSSEGGKTWKFTLKDGVKWQDGSPITSGDVKWSIERLFAPFITEGPPYIQQWLTQEDYKKAYGGPYGGKELDGIETPDDKTVVFHFKSPHADANYALAMTGYGIVPKAKDTKEKYDKEPFSSGPYIIAKHTVDKSMDLERNPNWDAASDPIRGAYPDKWHLEFGYQSLPVTDRFIADTGDDKKTFSFYTHVNAERVQQVLENPSLQSRVLRQPSPYANYYYFNLDRVKDIKIRQAIAYAWPTKQIQQITGGPNVSVISTTILNPSVSGWQDYDLFGVKQNPSGNVEKAKELLASSSNPKPTIVYGYNNTPTEQRVTVAIKNQLAKIGVNVVAKPMDTKTYYDAIGKVDNGLDMYWAGWGADWPTAATVFPVIFGPIADGGYNQSHLKDPAIKAEIDRIMNLSDANEANKAWGELDKKIMETVTPGVPALNDVGLQLHGSLVGGAETDPISWVVSPNTIFVKQ
ncbi:ABC transporter substrate-binding protein [Planotetraspora sp. A-T 1434]|uniref:ABC transporter substrate-binding protein n=1 Tax=Planotetraspora sp. A-T 1434 TaxID=2979219 RepID=UPI0021C15E70|nr:ABC transporter substrate-binding protein [Planotetraspora sp. A-T 1434]MCT9930694.1 ABC transporter substrate-binding protein [Planotetraspora sp. A-T 1434]